MGVDVDHAGHFLQQQPLNLMPNCPVNMVWKFFQLNKLTLAINATVDAMEVIPKLHTNMLKELVVLKETVITHTPLAVDPQAVANSKAQKSLSLSPDITLSAGVNLLLFVLLKDQTCAKSVMILLTLLSKC